MNERIEEFAEDCKILGEKEFAGKVVGFNYKKFAELIVKELITICTPDISGRLDGRPYETADDFDRGFIDGQDCCVELIKKHYGVEE
jgi:hypothetical protein